MAGDKTWKDKPLFAVIVVIVIVAAVGFTIWHRTSRKTVLGERTTIIVVCEETGDIFELEIETDSDPPYENPKTGRKTAYMAIHCGNCGAVYPMKVIPATENQCPNCGATVPNPVTFVPGKERDSGTPE
jgi:ribosomal protein S27E